MCCRCRFQAEGVASEQPAMILEGRAVQRGAWVRAEGAASNQLHPLLPSPDTLGGPCSAVASQVIAPEQVRKGFTAAIDGLDDFKLDVPDVVDQLATFICRCGCLVCCYMGV